MLENTYSKLAKFLTKQKNNEVSLSFDQINDIIKPESLPPSAYKHQAFWANTNSHQISKSILKERWVIVSPKKDILKDKVVKFCKLPEIKSINNELKRFDSLTNSQLSNFFRCSTQGGIRKSNLTNTIVIIFSYDSIYKDRWDSNGILWYTGQGEFGDQKMTNNNKILNETRFNGTPVFLFYKLDKKYYYEGEVKLIDAPILTNELDKDEKIVRKVFKFPFKRVNEYVYSYIAEMDIVKVEKKEEKELEKISIEDLRKLAEKASKNCSKKIINVATRQYQRNPIIAEYVKRRAKGICNLCGKEAPFLVKGKPYLECHHIIPLSEGGEDNINNTVALCPNCHRKMHALKLKEDIEKLSLKQVNNFEK